MRINQFIARSGITSRRKAEELIKAGHVFVNGQKVTELATEIDPNKDTVEVSGEEIKLPNLKYYAFSKPVGYTTTKEDPFALHTIFELLPNDNSLFPVGRLDRDTTGLLLVTNDGDFAQAIIHPTKKIEKEYLVRTKNEIREDEIESLLSGFELEDGFAKAVKIERVGKNEIKMTIEMGRNHIVKRMIAALGNKVTGLSRIRIGEILLDLPTGKFRDLTEKEIKPYV